MNKLRDIIREAQNKVKDLEWSQDLVVAVLATKIWTQLEAIRHELCSYEENKNENHISLSTL